MKITSRIVAAALAAVGGVVASSSHSLAADLSHLWKLDESTGTAALDSITSTSATLGGTSSFTSAKLNNGFKTTGGNLGYVNGGNVAIDGSFSLSFWVKPEDVSLDWRNMVSKHDGSAGAKSFWIGQNATDGSLRFGMYFDGTNELAVDTPASAVSNNAWSFVTTSWNESTHVQSIFVNGVLSASIARAASSFATPRSSNLLFNTNSTTATQGPGAGSWARFSGTLDDVGVWDNALTAGDVKSLYNAATTAGFEAFADAQSFAKIHEAYDTNFAVQTGNVRWTRATGLSLGEGAVQRKANGYVMQIDAAGIGVSALSTVSLSFDPQHTNLADATNGNDNNALSGPDHPAIHLSGTGQSEIDGLTSNSSIGSADIRPDGTLNGSVFVMLWTQDTAGTDDRATLRSEIAQSGGSTFSLLDSSAAEWSLFASQYSGFDTLIRFNNASLVGAINWDFATHTDIVVDKIAVAQVPEPVTGALVSFAFASLLGTRRNRKS